MTTKALCRLSLPASIAALTFFGAALAAKAAQYGDFTYAVDGEEIVITSYTGATSNVSIPGTIAGLPVTAIGAQAFKNELSLATVTIPDTILTIGGEAFNGATNLVTVNIGNGVATIGGAAFAFCRSLSEVNFPNNLRTIGGMAFYECSSLSTVTTPTGVTSIGAMAFANNSSLSTVTLGNGLTAIDGSTFQSCAQLTSVSIPDSVTSIFPQAFKGCTNLTNVVIPANVSSIGWAAFQDCSSLTNITIPEGLSSIDELTFFSCSSLTSLVIPDSVNSIEYLAFGNCGGLTSLTIGEGVTSIGLGAFQNCSGITNLRIPDSVAEIGGNSFAYCSNLSSVVIGKGITTISVAAFYLCFSLETIYFEGNAPPDCDPDAFGEAFPTIFYYAGTSGWGPTLGGRPAVRLGASIDVQPASVTALQGTDTILTVTAHGAAGYQWQKDELDIPLATDATLSLLNVQPSDAGSYRVIVQNPEGDLISNSATLTVLLDSDGDGLSDQEEGVLGTDPGLADNDGDGLDDRAEIQQYLTNPLLSDSDADGFNDGFEISTGFDPKTAGSSPESVSTIENAVCFRFNAGFGLSYQIEGSTDLKHWEILESPITGQGGVITRFYLTADLPHRFFRAKRQ